MKEATGELNMTVITVVAIAAIAAIFYAFVWPAIKTSLAENTCSTKCPNESSGMSCFDACMSSANNSQANNKIG